jgi:hypothetical protein
MFSCNPVKKVMRDPVRFDVVAKEVIRRGYCKADTVVQVIDSVIYRDSVIIEMVPCADFDTIIGSSRISVSSGVLTYKPTEIKQTIIKKIRDLSAEQVLRSDVAFRDSIINIGEKSILNLQITNREQKDETRKWKWRFWGLIGAIVLIVVGKITLKNYLNRF